MYKSVALVVFTALIFPAIALAKDKTPISLPKTSKWEINYDADSCHLLSKFGSGDDQITANFTRFTPGDSFDLTLYGKALKSGGSLKVASELGFGDQAPKRTEAMAGSAGNKQPMMIFNSQRLDGSSLPPNFVPPGNLPGVTPEQEAGISSLTFKAGGGKRYRLETGSLAKPMAAMRDCLDDLIKHWGYDPSVQSALKQMATPLSKPWQWLRSDDFPPGALYHGASGIVQIRLDIDEVGKVMGCHILRRTEPDEFADLSCKLIAKRASFSPALGASGQPVRSFYVTKIIWLAAGS